MKMGDKSRIKNRVPISSFLAAGAAGFVVDVSLFPQDTLINRLKSKQGFRKAGGFSGVFKGIGRQVTGSVPQASVFFLIYESLRHYMEPLVSSSTKPIVHVLAASAGEVVACLARVPMEMVEQRSSHVKDSSLNIVIKAYQQEGLLKGLYQGFSSTVLRRVPFSLVQFPLLEYFKNYYQKNFTNNVPLNCSEVGTCGSIAGMTAATVTCPLDVVKTRIMLLRKNSLQNETINVRNVFREIYREKGLRGLFAGLNPRLTWVSIGGYVFFCVYDLGIKLCDEHLFNLDLGYSAI